MDMGGGEGSAGELRDIGATILRGFVDANDLPIQTGFYTDSKVPNSLYYLRFNLARNLIIETPNNPATYKLSHDYMGVLSTHSLTRLSDEVVQGISDDREFIDLRVRKQKDDKFLRVTCRILDRVVSKEPFIK
jgi:hypothetical protein